MTSINISNGTVSLKLTLPRSKVRICDNEGNHLARPVRSVFNRNNYVEWMITNQELITLITQKFTRQEVDELIVELRDITISLRESEYYSRAAQKEKLNQTLANFSIYKYNEIFYSFEKNIEGNLRVRITFKMGDYTLAAHMYVLIGLNDSEIGLTNNSGELQEGSVFGSGAKCEWNPSVEIIKDIAKTLSHSSENHKSAIISLLEHLS